MSRAWHVFLAGLLGSPCRLGCGQRVYARDVAEHEDDEHAGDRA